MTAFSLDEAFEIAIRIERNGARYYHKAAQFCEDEHARNLLVELASWEHKHEAIFKELRKETSDEKFQGIDDPRDEAIPYIRAMADGKVFPVDADPAANLTGDESPEEVLSVALGLEKDSVLFYLGMKDMVSKGADRVEAIIREEMKHIRVISEERAKLQQ
ncbi:MAG: rubrerythrin [Phycisphaerae bacterium]